MDDLDINILIGLIAYAVGFAHSKAVSGSVRKTVNQWLSESIGDSAKFGLMFMDDARDRDGNTLDKIEANVKVDDQLVKVLIEKCVEQN